MKPARAARRTRSPGAGARRGTRPLGAASISAPARPTSSACADLLSAARYCCRPGAAALQHRRQGSARIWQRSPGGRNPGLPRRAAARSGRLANLSDKLVIPDNITLMPLPPKSPELNPDRQHLCSSCAITGSPIGYSDPTKISSTTGCHAWNKLVDQPWTIMSIGLRDWAHRS